MKLFVFSWFDDQAIRADLGRPGHSTHFIRAAFEPVLRRLGDVVPVTDLSTVDDLFDACAESGEPCALLCFALPHQVPITLRCPTIPIFGWEFTTIPCESWNGEPFNDWRVVFRHCGRAIALSSHAAALVRDTMGEDFPVAAIPPPVFDRFAALREAAPVLAGRDIICHGDLFDTEADPRFLTGPVWSPPPAAEPVIAPAAVEPAVEAEPAVAPAAEIPPRLGARARLSLTLHYLLAWYRAVLRDLMPAPARRALSVSGRLAFRLYRRAAPAAVPEPLAESREATPGVAAPVGSLPAATAPAPAPPEIRLRLHGVVYVSMFSPEDWCKNWQDSVSAFVWAFRDNAQATLVLKLPPWAAGPAFADIEDWLLQFAPFRCRIVALFGFLDPPELAALIRAAHFYVNSSAGESSGLPVLEFLSAGRPAIAPHHTAMADVLTERAGFPLRSAKEHNVWPHDPRRLFTTMRHRLDWSSILAAYETSFAVATAADDGYRRMAAEAQAAARRFCAAPVAEQRLRNFLDFRDTPAMPAAAE